jgi:hypothetical protein
MTERIGRRPGASVGAILGSVDLPAEDDEGPPHGIWPREQCAIWHAEVIRDGDHVLAREWHASGCPRFRELIREGA